MKKLLYILLCLVLVCSCDLTKKNAKQNDNVYGVSVSSIYKMSIDTFTVVQVDSMTKADKLPNKSKWETTYLKDGETNVAYEYKTLYDKNTGIIYTLKYLKNQKLYVVKKRKTTSK